MFTIRAWASDRYTDWRTLPMWHWAAFAREFAALLIGRQHQRAKLPHADSK